MAMTDRDEVIKHLSFLHAWCAVNPKYGMGLTMDDCRKAAGWLEDAIAQLKALEPRVLPLLEAAEADVCWIEGKGVSRVIPGRVYMVGNAGELHIHKLIAAPEQVYAEDYGVIWRCWSARPSDEQREVTPWR